MILTGRWSEEQLEEMRKRVPSKPLGLAVPPVPMSMPVSMPMRHTPYEVLSKEEREAHNERIKQAQLSTPKQGCCGG
jgi:hypothetical protein